MGWGGRGEEGRKERGGGGAASVPPGSFDAHLTLLCHSAILAF